MDLLGCYDSDDGIAASFISKIGRIKTNDDPDLIRKSTFQTKGNKTSIDLVDDVQKEENLNSRIHSVYYKSDIVNSAKSQNESADTKSAKDETILYNANSKSDVLSIIIGSRDTPTGIKIVDEGEYNLVETKAKDIKYLEDKQIANFKNIIKEHTGNPENMIMASYSIDHPAYKNINSTDDIECFGKVENLGSVHINPSGISEKIYYNDVSFREELLNNDLYIAVSNDEALLNQKKKRRLSSSDVDSDLFGSWIPYEENVLPVAPIEKEDILPDKEVKTEVKPKQNVLFLPPCTRNTSDVLNEVIDVDGRQQTKFNGIVVSTLHKKSSAQSWLLPSKNIKVLDLNSYKAQLPRREIFTYTGHTMAVQKILYFPMTGHYILSASMDGFIKIWDSNNNRKCVRTYKGHSKGVRDINFSGIDGKSFYSCGFDSSIIQWDTEYGKIIGVYSIDKTPYCLTVDPNNENMFLVGGDNKKVCQFDSRTGEIALEYSEHLGCVNTITFIDNNRKFVTTGDDKKIVVWEYNIPVVVKQISTPSMHSMPAVVSHPTDKFILAQSMDNQILVYESSGTRFKFYGGKRFKGHNNIGYAIRPQCSLDGKYVVSGDSRGRIFFWDWKTCKNILTLSGHKSVVIDCKWHPTQSSRLATCSWDGTIKLWD